MKIANDENNIKWVAYQIYDNEVFGKCISFHDKNGQLVYSRSATLNEVQLENLSRLLLNLLSLHDSQVDREAKS